MSIENPQTITDLFQRHGIRTVITGQVLQIQELAMAISLQGRFSVTTTYVGSSNSLVVMVRDTSDLDPDLGLGRELVNFHVFMPSESRPAPDAAKELSQIIATLNQYLREGASQ